MSNYLSNFPLHRPRRLRSSKWIRKLVREQVELIPREKIDQIIREEIERVISEKLMSAKISFNQKDKI